MSGNYLLTIVAHPARRDMVEGRFGLKEQALADGVVWDDCGRGVTRNHIAALDDMNLAAAGCEWAVVLEDDAEPVSDFPDQLYQALDHAPSGIVSLYNGTGYPAQYQRRFSVAASSDACWILHKYMRHAVGYAIHRRVLSLGIVDHMGRMADLGWAPDDAIGEWAAKWGTPIAYTNPSLVDHKDVPSVIEVRKFRGRPVLGRARSRPRRAHRAGSRDVWTDNAITV